MLLLSYLTIPFTSSYRLFFSYTLSLFVYRITTFLSAPYTSSLKGIVRPLTSFIKPKFIKSYMFTTIVIKDKRWSCRVSWSTSSLKSFLPSTLFKCSLFSSNVSHLFCFSFITFSNSHLYKFFLPLININSLLPPKTIRLFI